MDLDWYDGGWVQGSPCVQQLSAEPDGGRGDGPMGFIQPDTRMWLGSKPPAAAPKMKRAAPVRNARSARSGKA